jgi:hypothetical protein
MEPALGTEVVRVSGTQRAVASVFKAKSGGHIVLLPAMRFDVHSNLREGEKPRDPKQRWVDEASEFQVDLFAALEQLSGASVASRPAWAAGYTTAHQRKLREDIVRQEKRIESARAKLSVMQQRREENEAIQQLFLGSGRALELEVRKVLELLGGTVTEPEPDREDWIVTFPEGEAVLEVKGLTKSAAEKNAAQLEKWVATRLESTGNRPKGILIVNTWREKPLDERTEADFPAQMIPYSTSREHCLVTGLQLFVIRAQVEADSNQAAHWRKALLETVGCISGCDDWRSMLEEIKEEETK